MQRQRLDELKYDMLELEEYAWLTREVQDRVMCAAQAITDRLPLDSNMVLLALNELVLGLQYDEAEIEACVSGETT